MADKQNTTPTEQAQPAVPVATEPVAAPAVPAPKPEPTMDELKAKIKAMVDAGNFGSEFGALSKQLAASQAKAEVAEREAKETALKDITGKVQDAIGKAIEPFLKEIEAKGGDGVWFVSDWGEMLVDTRLIKKRPAVAKKSGSGGGGKKFNVSTEDLLKEHGHKQYREDGTTYQQAYEADTGGNARYQVRIKLLKEAGLTG